MTQSSLHLGLIGLIDADPRRRAPDEGCDRNREEAQKVGGGQGPTLDRVRDPEVRERERRLTGGWITWTQLDVEGN